jgi:hypothetical protein
VPAIFVLHRNPYDWKSITGITSALSDGRGGDDHDEAGIVGTAEDAPGI